MLSNPIKAHHLAVQLDLRMGIGVTSLGMSLVCVGRHLYNLVLSNIIHNLVKNKNKNSDIIF